MQMEYSLEKNVSISSGWMFASDSVSLPRLDNPTGACPTHRRQWADFLVSLMAPLHRQYKTARTETRRHLLLKIRQMPTQTSASRGYVLFDIKVAFMPPVVWCHKGHTRKSYKLSPGCEHDPRSAPNLERHGSSQMQTFGWLEMPHFLNRISICIFIWNPTVWSSHNITYQSKARYAYCDNSLLGGREVTCHVEIWKLWIYVYILKKCLDLECTPGCRL